MKTNTLNLILGLLLLFTGSTIAQSNKVQTVRWPAKKSDVEKVKERTLLVGLPAAPGVNEKLKSIFGKVWDFSPVQFVDAQSIPSLIDGKEEDYAVMSIRLIQIKQGGFIIGGISSNYIRFEVKLAEKYDKRKSIYYQDVFFTMDGERVNLGEREIYVGLYNIMNHYKSRSNGEGIIEATLKNANKLENRTLLVDKAFLHEKMNKEKIAELYPYPFKVVDEAYIVTALRDNDDKYAFVELLPVGTATNMLTHEIYDCKDGERLSSGELHNGAFDSYSNYVNDDHLRAYVKNYKKLNEMAENRKE